MTLTTEPYLAQQARWPRSGRHILAQYDAGSVVVYRAYRPEIGHFAARHGYFGGGLSTSRMGRVKPNFLWMMDLSGGARRRTRRSRWPSASIEPPSTRSCGRLSTPPLPPRS